MVINLGKFLEEMDTLNKHPYSAGLDTNKMIQDLKGYVKQLECVIEE